MVASKRKILRAWHAREEAGVCSSAGGEETSAYLVRTLGEEAVREISPTEDPRVSLGEMPVFGVRTRDWDQRERRRSAGIRKKPAVAK